MDVIPGVFNCKICPRSFDRLRHLKYHITAVHEHIKPYKCEFCNMFFNLSSALNGHKESVHEGKINCKSFVKELYINKPIYL